MAEVSEISEKIYSLLGLDKRHDNLVTSMLGSMRLNVAKGKGYQQWYDKHRLILSYDLEEFGKILKEKGFSPLTEDDFRLMYDRCLRAFCDN